MNYKSLAIINLICAAINLVIGVTFREPVSAVMYVLCMSMGLYCTYKTLSDN